MSISALNWAFEQDLPHAEKSVLVALAHRADKQGYCYPGQKTLATMTGASESTVRRAIKALEAKGLISREDRRRKNGSRTSTGYNLPVNMTANLPVTMTDREDEPTGHHDTPLPVTMTGPPYKSVTISQIVPTEHEQKNDTTMIQKEPPRTTQTLIAEWIDGIGYDPPSRVIGHLSREIKNLLTEGYEYDQVRAAVIEWNRKGLHPSTLPSILDQVLKTQTQPSSTNHRMTQALTLGQQLQAEYEQWTKDAS